MAEKAGTVSSAARSLRPAVRAPRLGSSEARTYKPLEGRTSRGFLVCEPPRLAGQSSAYVSSAASDTLHEFATPERNDALLVSSSVLTRSCHSAEPPRSLSPRCSHPTAAPHSLGAYPARDETSRAALGQRAPELTLRPRSIRIPRPMTLDDRLAGLAVLLVVLGCVAYTAWSLV